jgi:hypothetical protein
MATASNIPCRRTCAGAIQHSVLGGALALQSVDPTRSTKTSCAIAIS